MIPKITIFIPVYNSVTYVSKIFDSILEQEFYHIELIIIDDGSLDDFDCFFSSYYKGVFLDKLFSVIYIRQENKGQAFSLNRALKLITGEYFTWIDSDDWLEGNSIIERIKFLDNNKDYGMVRTDGFIVDQTTGEKRLYSKNIDFTNEFIFDDLIFERNIYFCPIGYMVRTKSLFKVISNKNIYVSRGGQNWQILLPIANEFKCGYINKPLFNYLVRSDSHSRVDKGNLNNLILKYNEHYRIIKETLSKIGVFSSYEKRLKNKYDNIKVSVFFKNKSNFNLNKYEVKISNLTLKSLIKLTLIKILYKIK